MVNSAKIAKGGKISIPASYRKQLHLKEGDKVVFILKENEMIISPLSIALKKSRNINKYYSPEESLVDKLIIERRNEAKNE
ncbi:MAG TPA: AbrB/MazE/SpoVT family DNA-binding domain-containing protein [Rickettsia endosymbiont of Diachasma alloeum]|nr:AbrB/MazE/SpoVT family DNA-binding domain-containing protein [Rickettsia endosymbiont of Diachasma alloeum]